jgi:LysM repeat protein
MLALAVIGLAIGSLFPITGSNSWTVQSGDTLWSIAADIPGAPDTTTAIVDLRELNNLSSDYLHVGQVIKLPKYE